MLSFNRQDGTHGQIDPRIAQLRLQNTQIPIRRLPPELLTSIFLYARYNASDGKRSHLALILSWVSSYWRDVVLSDPAIWTLLDVESEDIVNSFLTRSRDSKLLVDLYRPSPNDFVPIIKELHRLESLVLYCPEVDIDVGQGMHDDSTLRPYWSNPAPYLRKLSLHYFPIPPNPFENLSPALRDVELTWCAFDWSTFPFSNLTSLKIVCPEDQISPFHLLQKIQQMPFLENLELEGALLGIDGPGPARHRLLHLKSLEIRGALPDTLVDFLQRVSVPATAQLSVEPDNSGGLVPEMMAQLRACLDRESRKLCKFRLGAHVTVLSFEVHQVLSTSNEQGALQPLLHGSFGEWEFDDSIAYELFHHYDFSELTELTLHSDHQEINTNIWTTIFTPLLHLTVLDLEGTFAASFIGHFSTSVRLIGDLLPPDMEIEDVARGQLRERMMLPSLERLALRRSGGFVEEFREERTKWPGEFAMFRFALLVRQLVGCNLRELEVVRYSLTTQQVADLKRAVDNLVFEDELSWGWR
ncbi:hypothetical protein BDN72DRAFT_840188 [Pluteus cervinus]|uniref:Uncharacterized protein n=1 Tax=Pluteus cervinus TaxID=181527 RepID=A0ACD3AUD9_9AGAR|nr:hypothetical protein BDN72DRAFT_840188 [Pluteus cervinus]